MFQVIPGPRDDVVQVLAGPHKNFQYLVANGTEAIAVDPTWDLPAFFAAAKTRGWTVRGAIFTHGHWDHIGGVPEVFEYGVEWVAWHEAAAKHPKAKEAGGRFRPLRDGEVVADIRVVHTPGHQPESSCFVANGCLFGGDTLFVDTCGRTDFPGGNTDAMYASLENIRQLPGELWVMPGHHYADLPHVRLREAIVSNPALATRDRQAFEKLVCLRD